MLVRSVLRLSPNEPTSDLGAAFNGEGQPGNDGGESDQVPDEFKQNPTFQRLYNENRKMQRLLGKSNREIEDMKKQIGELGQLRSQFQQLAGAFGGGQQQASGEQRMSYLDKVRNADKMIREQDPSSGGLALTLEGAELIESIRRENEELKRMANNMMNPQFAAEQIMFVNIETALKSQIEDLYGAENVDDNYPDFQRVAIERMKAIKADPKKWASLVSNNKLQNDFVKHVVAAKVPKMANVPGWQKIETYSVEDAKRDLVRAEQLAKDGHRQEASELQKKARQALLPYTLGIAMQN